MNDAHEPERQNSQAENSEQPTPPPVSEIFPPMSEPEDFNRSQSFPSPSSLPQQAQNYPQATRATFVAGPHLSQTSAFQAPGASAQTERPYPPINHGGSTPYQGYRAYAPMTGNVYNGAPTGQQQYMGYTPQLRTQKKPRTGMIITSTAIIAALLGGVAGFGGSWLYNQSIPSAPQTIQGQSNITINNPDSANLITAVAAKAAPSVVTLSVSAGQSAGTGSGVILTADGYVLTNNHVVTFDGVRAEPSISVKTSDGTLYGATVVAVDPTMDLAVIKLRNATGLAPITFADSDQLNVGDEAVAIGAPLGLEGTVTQGIISALDRSINISAPRVPEEQGDDDDMFNFWNNTPELLNPNSNRDNLISLPVIQTDASINPGNSGGALLNTKGELIGINVAIATASSSSDTAGSIGVGFSIPSNLAKRVADELINNQAASHGLLGASIRNAVIEDSNPSVAGAYVASIIEGGAADTVGLRVGDIVTRFNGKAINGSSDLTAQVRYLPGGADAELVFVRDGKQHTVNVTLGEMADLS